MIRFSNTEYFYMLVFLLVLMILFWLYNIWRKGALKRFGTVDIVLALIPRFAKIKPVFKFLLLVILNLVNE